jgi:gliding motility-associated-like protein
MHPNNKVVIFNRWGDKLIEIDHYDNVSKAWDGKYNGALVATGTYYFIVQYYDDGQQKAGWLQINY